MRGARGFDLDARRDCPTWTEALRLFVAQADDLGVLVMASGVVGGNNHRKLDPEEFQLGLETMSVLISCVQAASVSSDGRINDSAGIPSPLCRFQIIFNVSGRFRLSTS